MATIAITRAVSPSLADCLLTHLPRVPIDVPRAVQDHDRYEQALRSLRVEVIRLPAEPSLPDSVFVEDTAVVLDEVAVIARPGSPSRRPETETVAGILGGYRSLARIEPPATLDGGDVLRMGRTLYVGLSSRTNREAVSQLRSLLAPRGYRVVPLEVTGCLHLKSAATAVADDLVLLNPRWIRPGEFAPLNTVAVATEEPHAANALRIHDAVLHAEHHPRTAERLELAGLKVIRVPCAEIAKAEGGLTCCSILFEAG